MISKPRGEEVGPITAELQLISHKQQHKTMYFVMCKKKDEKMRVYANCSGNGQSVDIVLT